MSSDSELFSTYVTAPGERLGMRLEEFLNPSRVERTSSRLAQDLDEIQEAERQAAEGSERVIGGSALYHSQ